MLVLERQLCVVYEMSVNIFNIWQCWSWKDIFVLCIEMSVNDWHYWSQKDNFMLCIAMSVNDCQCWSCKDNFVFCS